MRYILFSLIVTVTGCSGQQNTEQQNKIDTAKLFNPTAHPDNSGASDMSIFKRNIVLTQPDYYVTLNEQEHKFETTAKLKDFINSNKGEIQKDLFYIIIDSTTAFKKTASIINILVENRVSNYKVINYQQYFAPSELVPISTPSSVVSKPLENDSTYFFIEILNNGFDLKLSGQETKLKNVSELDNFIRTYKSEIKKIIIITTKELPENKFEPVLEVLKKHGYFKYNLVTK